MANQFTREFETLEALIEKQYGDDEDRKWPTVALLGVIDVLHDHWEAIENEEEVDADLAGQTLDAIMDVIHCVIVHQELPLTEAEAIALEDQQVAQFRDDLEGLGDKLGIDLKILNLDQALKEAYAPKPEETNKKEEEE